MHSTPELFTTRAGTAVSPKKHSSDAAVGRDRPLTRTVSPPSALPRCGCTAVTTTGSMYRNRTGVGAFSRRPLITTVSSTVLADGTPGTRQVREEFDCTAATLFCSPN